jgi:hypothetical protein
MLQSRLQGSPYWDLVELRTNINEAIRLYQLGTLRWKQRFQAQSVLGQVFYDLTTLPGTLNAANQPCILIPLRISFNSNPLFFSTLDDMDNSGIESWQIQSTAEAGAPDVPQLWGLVGLNYAFLYPADSVGGNALQIDAAIQAPLFATDGSGDDAFLNLDSGEVSTLLDYAQHVSQFKRGSGRVQATMPKLKSFMKAISLQNSFFAASAIFKKNYADQKDRSTRPRLASDQSGVPATPRYR